VGFFRRRVIPDNARETKTVYYVPDPFSVQAASLGFATNTISPMSAGSGPGGGRFFGDPGYGVNRWGGALAYLAGTKQDQRSLAQPVLAPLSQRLGYGAGVAGQPGLPSTGQDAAAYGSLRMMGSASGYGYGG
jgi:hypothetical protein